MTFGTLLFSRWDWIWPSAVLLLVALVVLVWTYRAAPAGPAKWVCPSLKACGILALLICLLEPLWSGQRARPGANLFAVVADNSEGLRIRDRGSARTRAEEMARLLDPQKSAWQTSLEEAFDVRRYWFDSRLQSARDFSELTFEGGSSAIGGALRGLVERYRDRPLAGVLLFTDGNATDLRAAPDLAGSPPVYPVMIGSSDRLRDLAVQQVRTTQTDFEDAPVSIQADVAATGCAGEAVVAQVLDVQGKTVAEQRLRVSKPVETLGFRFQLKPDRPGLGFYKLQVRAQSETPSKSEPAATEEATLANNDAFVAVNRGVGPYRILYVSGRPNWEFKFLNRALQEDAQLQLTALIRVAKREPKFNFIGRAGETSNPLFRGFDNQAPEDVERYDQPVLVRLNTRDAQELRAGFPATPEDLFGFHAVIIDDLEAQFFSADQMMLLQRFVSERGGGFLMLGGSESFQQGKYHRTPIGDMLPVYLDKTEVAGPNATFRFDLTREGWLQSWARLRDNEADEKDRLGAMVPFQVMNRVSQVKPGASVIATATDAEGQQRPALVVQRFGHGRSAALTVGDFWRWGLHDSESHKDMDQTWRQMARWLVTDVPNRVDVVADPRPEEGSGAVQLKVRVRDPQFQPLDNAAVAVEVQPVLTSGPGNAQPKPVKLRAEPSPDEPGLYLASYLSRTPGAFRASVTATNDSGGDVGHAETGWSTDLASQEFHSLVPNRALLEDIARKTGGQVLTAADLAGFVKTLPQRHAPVMEGWTYPVWHTPALFLFALGCFASEWGIRRWRGLP
jgi:uncharacterized membrane protein